MATNSVALTKAEKANTMRELLTRADVKEQIKLVLPQHLSPDRLLRVALTAILRTPALLDCTRESILSCVLTAAQLGLEPDQFLGQAYLIPFRNNKKGVMECQIMPGYRGYISLARRTGEVQSVNAQVVYTRDKFDLVYGLEERLEHRPAEGDRGEPRGAYVVFHYKDGSRSFDYMSTSDIERIRKRSKTPDNGPWVTDWDEMAKKTVIKRHAKLAPMSVEFARATALEDRALSGKSQFDLMFGNEEEEAEEQSIGSSDSSSGPTEEMIEAAQKKLMDEAPKKISEVFSPDDVQEFLVLTASGLRKTVSETIIEASQDGKEFWRAFAKWAAKAKAPKKEEGKEPPKGVSPREQAPGQAGNPPADLGTKDPQQGVSNPPPPGQENGKKEPEPEKKPPEKTEPPKKENPPAGQKVSSLKTLTEKYHQNPKLYYAALGALEKRQVLDDKDAELVLAKMKEMEEDQKK